MRAEIKSYECLLEEFTANHDMHIQKLKNKYEVDMIELQH